MKRIYEVEFMGGWKRTPKTFHGTPYSDPEKISVFSSGDASMAVSKAKTWALGRRERGDDGSYDLTCVSFKLLAVRVLAEAEL